MRPSDLVLILAAAGQTALAAPAATSCKDVFFTVSGTAQNLNLTGFSLNGLNASQLQQIFAADTFQRIPVSGSQKIGGTYCKPPNDNGRLQVFFPSITANRESFTAQGGPTFGYPPYQPDMYSWVQYANARGFPTLALDRLGTGKSSHPDPVLVVQAPYETELYHDLAQQLRAGTTKVLPRSYSRLTWVGNSYGSQLGSSSAAKYPNDWNEYILTGFSDLVQTDLPGVLLLGPLPAAIVDPARFGTLDPGYVTSPVEQSRTNSFFGNPKDVDFDPEVAHLYFTRKDVVSVGQFVSIYTVATQKAPNYKGRVIVLTGEQDEAFCGLGSSAIATGMCGPLLEQTGSLFPNAQYNWHSINKTGHATILHKSSMKTLNFAFRFLNGESIKGGPPA